MSDATFPRAGITDADVDRLLAHAAFTPPEPSADFIRRIVTAAAQTAQAGGSGRRQPGGRWSRRWTRGALALGFAGAAAAAAALTAVHGDLRQLAKLPSMIFAPHHALHRSQTSLRSDTANAPAVYGQPIVANSATVVLAPLQAQQAEVAAPAIKAAHEPTFTPAPNLRPHERAPTRTLPGSPTYIGAHVHQSVSRVAQAKRFGRHQPSYSPPNEGDVSADRPERLERDSKFEPPQVESSPRPRANSPRSENQPISDTKGNDGSSAPKVENKPPVESAHQETTPSDRIRDKSVDPLGGKSPAENPRARVPPRRFLGQGPQSAGRRPAGRGGRRF